MFHSEPQHVGVAEYSDGPPYWISVTHEHGYCIPFVFLQARLNQDLVELPRDPFLPQDMDPSNVVHVLKEQITFAGTA